MPTWAQRDLEPVQAERENIALSYMTRLLRLTPRYAPTIRIAAGAALT
jgi:hypothetical protein